MARNTEFRNAGSRFGSTIRQSLDLITGRNVNNYMLLFLDPTKQHKKGESKNIVVPYIVLGRSASCHVQYGDDFPTVSRQHASIQSDDKGCTLIHNPQATNPTYVDGRPINGYHNLESGDEIQLSQDGPRIRILMDKSVKTSTMGFTRRMSMAIGQSLRPYKRALMLTGVLLLGIIGYSIWSTLKVSELETEQKNLNDQMKAAEDSVIAHMITLQNLGIKTSRNADTIESIKKNIEKIEKNKVVFSGNSIGGGGVSSVTVSKLLETLEDNIYFIYIDDVVPGDNSPELAKAAEDIQGYSGTGFLTTDGRLYTARHVIEPWYYPDESCDALATMNDYLSGGGSINVTYYAISSSDSFPFNNGEIRDDKSIDKADDYDCEGVELNIIAPGSSSTDYAYIPMGNRKSNILYDRQLSSNLERGETLYVLGYPLGTIPQERNGLSPVYSEARVAQKGIKKGLLYVTSISMVGGNSGGPVFAMRNNKLIVVGLVSGGYDKVGVVVPAANFR